MNPLQLRCEQLLRELHLDADGPIVAIEPLAGGVSSDIALITLPGRKVCVKFALPALKTSEHWTAPVTRNLAEYRWLQAVGQILPARVPCLLGQSVDDLGFAMEYIEPAGAANYKQMLLAGTPDTGQAASVGRALGQIHHASTRTGFNRHGFDNAIDFRALRLDPYLLHTARHFGDRPLLSERLRTLTAHCEANSYVLIHGDVSPKNLLIAQSGPIFLDAECATYGDPAFDIAFFANHLLLKAVHLPGQRSNLLAALHECWEQYRVNIQWEPETMVEQRFVHLLPALMLARIDGKSPVEYLSDDDRLLVRTFAIEHLTNPVDRLDALTTSLRNTLASPPDRPAVAQ